MEINYDAIAFKPEVLNFADNIKVVVMLIRRT